MRFTLGNIYGLVLLPEGSLIADTLNAAPNVTFAIIKMYLAYYTNPLFTLWLDKLVRFTLADISGVY